MFETVYLLCGFASLLCAILLLRAYRGNRTPLLLWSSVCFIGMFLNNVFLFLDMVVIDYIDFSLTRHCIATFSAVTLLYGLITSGE